MKASLSDRFKARCADAVFLIQFVLLLGLFFAAVWAVLEALRWIGARLFIDGAIGAYIRLDRNAVVNEFPNNIIAVAYVMFAVSVLLNAWQVFRRPWRGGRKLGAQRADARQQLKRFAMATPVFLLLCLPGMNTYTLVTPSVVVQKPFFALHAQTYPLKTVTKVQCTVAGRGLIFTDLTFSDGRSLEVGGFHRWLMDAIASAAGVAVDYDSRCRSEFGIDASAQSRPQNGA